MPIRNITTDYSGRSKDINIFPSVSPSKAGAQKVTPSFGKVSSYCAGVQKLIQRYAIALLTVKGSQAAYPNFGTGLVKQLNMSRLTNQPDLVHAFNFANAAVIGQFRAYQETTTGLPADEQLDTAVLLSVTATANLEVSYRVALYTKAGSTLDFLLPIPISK